LEKSKCCGRDKKSSQSQFGAQSVRSHRTVLTMKLKIFWHTLIIFLALITIALTSLDSSIYITLNSVIDVSSAVFKKYGDDEMSQLLNNANRECLKNRLKLDENGGKLVRLDLAIFVAFPLSLLCLDDARKEFEAALVRNSRDGPECLMQRLMELEPESRLLDGFESNPNALCLFPESNLDAIVSRSAERLKELEIAKCVTIDRKKLETEYVKESIVRALLKMPGGLTEDVKDELFDEMMDEHEELFECIMDEIEGEMRG
jgi:hypothetical protein